MATLYEYYNTGQNADLGAYGNDWKAQTFTPSEAHKIISVKLQLHRLGSPGTVTVSIRATSAGKPTGGDLCVGTTNGNTLPTNSPYEWREITLGAGYDLEADTKYAIVIRAPSGNNDNRARWRIDVSGEYAGGNAEDSTNSGSSWLTTYPDMDFMFEEWGGLPPLMVTTQAVSNVGKTTATGNGTIVYIGAENCDKRGMVYDKASHADPGDVAPGESGYDQYVEESNSFGEGAFSLAVVGLDELTTYYVRAYAHNPTDGYEYGAELLFGTINGYQLLFPDADGDLTQCYILPETPPTHWDKVAAPGDDKRVWHDGAYGFYPTDLFHFKNPDKRDDAIVKIKVRASGGHNNPLAHIREVLKSGGTVWYGDRESARIAIFRIHRTNPVTDNPWTLDEVDALQAGVKLTDTGIPSGVWCDYYYLKVLWVDAAVRTDGISNYTGTTATLNGTVLEDEGETTCKVYFEWGLTTSYGNTTTKQTKVKGDAFSANIGGLDPTKHYHYRSVIQPPRDEVGFQETFYGADQVFPRQMSQGYVIG